MSDVGVLQPSEQVIARVQKVAAQLPMPIDPDVLVNGRAALLGLESRGRTSAGGSCRLLPTTDGWVAINLPRADDLVAVPAIVEDAVDPNDPWPVLERFAAAHDSSAVAGRCQLLGVAGATLEDPDVDPDRAATVHRLGSPGARPSRPLVVDLSSMWAGPSCARLLGLAGMEVVKVESTRRPDGARAGDPRFFAWLHRGHRCVTFDFDVPSGRAELAELLGHADVVIESSRPRALAQLGIDAREVVADRPGRTWVSITGYGRGEAAEKVAFGDDAAVAGGLVGRDEEGLPVFCGDAIADPLSGLFAAATAYRSIDDGGGHLVEVAMASVARSLAEAAG